MMRSLFLLLLFAGPAAAAPACPPYAGAIALDFETLRPTTRIDNSLNVTAIRDVVRGEVQPGLDAHRDALDVTLTTPIFALDARTRIEPREQGACVYLERVTAQFGYRSMLVHVASEYPPGTCEYNAIVDHENQHVSINRSALDTHAGQMRLALERLLGEQAPVLTRDPARATRDILDNLSRRMTPEVNAFYREIEARNGAIDSESNYDAIAGICKDWAKGNRWPEKR